jgi:hypothetical protein
MMAITTNSSTKVKPAREPETQKRRGNERLVERANAHALLGQEWRRVMESVCGFLKAWLGRHQSAYPSGGKLTRFFLAIGLANG